MDYELVIGDQVSIYWRGWPLDMKHMWLHRMRLTIPILGEFTQLEDFYLAEIERGMSNECYH